MSRGMCPTLNSKLLSEAKHVIYIVLLMCTYKKMYIFEIIALLHNTFNSYCPENVTITQFMLLLLYFCTIILHI